MWLLEATTIVSISKVSFHRIALKGEGDKGACIIAYNKFRQFLNIIIQMFVINIMLLYRHAPSQVIGVTG